MNFRRDGKTVHEDESAWNSWLAANADLLQLCGLPPGVLRSRRDWQYLLDNGYWCRDYYGSHVGLVDFDLNSMNPSQLKAFHGLLEQTLTDDEKCCGCAAWHYVCPPAKA